MDHRAEVFVCDACAEVSIRLPDTLDPPCCRACVNEARRAINRWARAEPTSRAAFGIASTRVLAPSRSR